MAQAERRHRSGAGNSVAGGFVFSDFFLRLRALLKGTAADGEIDDELTFHIDRQIESYKKAGLANKWRRFGQPSCRAH